jgi:hypothetical protein
MALYDSPVSPTQQVLFHPSAGRNYSRNGYAQVGNKTLPSNPISATRVTPSAIYTRGIIKPGGISGIGEAGYGQRYPNPPGLAKVRAYRPGTAGTAYTLKRTSLRDAFINDNPPPGSLRGLADDTPEAVDTGTTYGPNIPGSSPAQTNTSTGFFSTLENSIGTIFASAAATGTTQGALAVSNAITGAAAPSAPKPSTTTILGTPVSNTILGMSATTVLLLGGAAAAYFYFK